MPLHPVMLNTNELYDILRTRLFASLPAEADIRAVAQAYAQAVKDAKQMDITNASPDEFARQLARKGDSSSIMRGSGWNRSDVPGVSAW